jgi:predicted site-specific integrase-resolvase
MSPPKNRINTAKAAKIAGISKPTLLRWLREGKIPEVSRDVRGWRVFTREEVARIKDYANAILPPSENN